MARDPLREEIEREFVVERDGWANERVGRVTERLQRDRPAAERFETIVVWFDDHNAFTAPGGTIYMSRRLLERFADDDAAAFVIAHELAHHRLGHIPSLSQHWLLLPLSLVLAFLRMRIATPERERDADLLAIELCLEAGYDAERCIAALRHLDAVSLDYGDIDGALGPDEDERGRGGAGARRSHPPLRSRIEAVRAHVAGLKSGLRLDPAVPRHRERRRRQVALAAAGTAVLTVAVVLLLRRPPGA